MDLEQCMRQKAACFAYEVLIVSASTEIGTLYHLLHRLYIASAEMDWKQSSALYPVVGFVADVLTPAYTCRRMIMQSRRLTYNPIASKLFLLWCMCSCVEATAMQH